jgi:acyl-CoA reductase-like NAD-dependent aldehyde dehydrogenase
MLDYETIYVNGQWEIVPDSKPLAVTDPATGEAVGSAPNCSGAVVDLAVAAARHAFPSWSNTDRAERRDLLVRLVTLLRDDAENLAQIIHREMGSTIEFSRSEQVGTPICIIEGYIDALTDDEPEEWIGNSLIVREPVGVVGAITPWNYPLYQLVTKVVPAMAAGCTVVAKPPEIAPLSSYRFAELLDEAGVPPGVFNLVNGLGSVVGEAIVRHPDVDMVSFTGSTRAGRRVGAVAAETIKRVSLELGGKSASIVLDGADLEQAVRATMGYCMANSGQVCNAWTRLLVQGAALETVEAVLQDTAAEFNAALGPLVSWGQYEQVQDLIQSGIDDGARIVLGGLGHPPGHSDGPYARPTVFADVEPSMRVAREEVFGPVLVLLTYDDVDDAVRIANDSVYGLHGAVWARDTTEGIAVARRLRTGQVDVNGAEFNILAPFGGYKQSGNGRELGRYGLEEFQEIKSIQV